MAVCCRQRWFRIGLLLRLPLARALIVLMVVAQVSAAYSEPMQTEVDLNNLKFKRVSNAELELIGETRAIVQDAFGFMWFGGVHGLARWDGYTAEIFTHHEPDVYSMSTNNVNAMVAEPNGDVWIATYWGLNRYQAATGRFMRYNFDPDNPRSISSNNVLALHITRDGTLWVGTDGGGLLRYVRQSNDFDRFEANARDATSLASNRIMALAEDGNGDMWVGLKNLGVDVFSPESQSVILRHRAVKGGEQGLSQGHAGDICQDAQGAMWVGTYDGLNRYLGEGRFKHYRFDPADPKSIAASNVYSLHCAEHYVWAGVGDRGVSVYDPASGGFARALGRGNFIKSIYTDSSGAQWLGLARGEVFRLDRYASTVINYVNDPRNDNSLTSSEVLSMVEDELGNFWVGTRGGLNYINRHTGDITRYTHSDDVRGILPSPAVSSLILQHGNILWVGTPWGGLTRLNTDTKAFKQYNVEEGNPHSLANREVWSMHLDEQGIIWVGTHSGYLHRYRPETDDFIRYYFAAAGGSSAGRAVSIDEDSAGNLWISGDFGLYRFPKANRQPGAEQRNMAELFEYIGAEENALGLRLETPVARHVFEDANKDLWVATGGIGVVRWRPSDGSSQTYTEADGLISNSATAITQDVEGHIWVSTEAGISRLNLNTNTYKNFTSANGLPGNAFIAGAVMNTSQGEIAFGGLKGMSIIKPQHTYANVFQAPLTVTGLNLFTEPVMVRERFIDVFGQQAFLEDEDLLTLPTTPYQLGDVVLNHKQSVISFEFSLLSYDVPEKTTYRYKLDGFNDKWSKSTAHRMATYTNLDPGQYRFRVQAINNEGLPMHSDINIGVKVLPPWWQTWWAYSFYLMALFGVVFRTVYAQYKKRHFAEHQNKLLEAKVNERTEALKVAYQKMEAASYTDALTQLRNRHYFQDAIPTEVARIHRAFDQLTTEQERAASERYAAFLVLDIDYFKRVNDEYGHASGDLVLKAVSEVLRQCCRETDYLFRWGGEEFLVVCVDQKRGALTQIMERIRRAIEALHIELEDRQCITVTCSIGACHYPFDAKQPNWASTEQIIALADWCLYLAKNAGRNRCASIHLHKSPEESYKSFFANIDQRIQDGVATVEGVDYPSL